MSTNIRIVGGVGVIAHELPPPSPTPVVFYTSSSGWKERLDPWARTPGRPHIPPAVLFSSMSAWDRIADLVTLFSMRGWTPAMLLGTRREDRYPGVTMWRISDLERFEGRIPLFVVPLGIGREVRPDPQLLLHLNPHELSICEQVAESGEDHPMIVLVDMRDATEVADRLLRDGNLPVELKARLCHKFRLAVAEAQVLRLKAQGAAT